ncbi:Hypothetical predicted protein, partial [Marmota monax]
MSSCPKRNVISSSYNSAQCRLVLKRRVSGSSKLKLPLGSSLAAEIPLKKTQCEKVAED